MTWAWTKTSAAIAVLSGVLMWSTAAHAGVLWRLNTEAAFITDSDSETQYMLGVGATALDGRKREAESASVLAGSHTFVHGGSETFGFLRLRGNYKASDSLSVSGRLALYANERWAPALPAAAIAFRPAPPAGIELSYERDIVDTLDAVRAKETVNTLAVSADYEIIRPVTVVGAYYHQFFSDGNDKDGFKGRLAFAPEGSYLGTTANFRYVKSKFKSPLYFSPEKDTEFIVIEQFKRPVAGEKYVLRLRGGLGWQWIDDHGFKTSKLMSLAEGAFKGWVNDHYGFDLLAGFTSNSQTQNFSRFYSLLVLTYSF